MTVNFTELKITMEHTNVVTEQCCNTMSLVTGDVYNVYSAIKNKNLIKLTLFIRKMRHHVAC